MKKIVTLITLSTLLPLSNSWSQGSLDWGVSIGGAEKDIIEAVTTDNGGNVYATGYFSGTVDFDAGSGVNQLTKTGSETDAFVTRYDDQGNFLWVNHISCTSGAQGFDVSFGTGYLYSVGFFKEDATFETSTPTTLSASNMPEVYIQRINAATGQTIWVKQLVGLEGDQAYTSAVDADGSVYVSGFFQGTVDFDPNAGTQSLTSNGNRDAFLLKIDRFGNFQWVKQIGGSGDDRGIAVAMASPLSITDGVLLTGYFNDDVAFDNGNIPVTHDSGTDMFVVKYSNSGVFDWVETITNSGALEPSSIASDGTAIYVGGEYSNSTDFDAGSGTAIPPSSNGFSGFILQLTAQGDFNWVKSYSRQSYVSYINSIAVNSNGEVYATGHFTGDQANPLDLDPSEGTDTITPNSVSNVTEGFFVSLDDSGEYLGGSQFAGSGSPLGRTLDVAFSPAGGGTIYMVGHYVGNVDLDPYATVEQKTSSGVEDSYLLRLSGCLPYASEYNLTPLGTCEYTWIDGQTYTADTIVSYTYALSNGCSVTTSLDLELGVFDTTITVSGATLTATGAASNYQWIDCSTGQAISGETNTDFTAAVAGDYAVVLSNGNCSDTSSCYTINSIGVNEYLSNPFVIYPNPAQEYIQVQGDQLSEFDIKIYDYSGKCVYQNINVIQKENIPLEIASGIYLVELSQENQIYRTTFIKD